MPSIHNDLKDANKNGSKNTRMNMDFSPVNYDYRKDEIMHLARYFKAVSVIQEMSKNLGRPIKVLDVGCGNCYVGKLLYKSIQNKKSELVSLYHGIDIDPIIQETLTESFKSSMSVKIDIRDLTVEGIPSEDNKYDLIVCFEMFEHIHPQFAGGLMSEIKRVLSPAGVLLFSTPNSNGSNKDLPKDHLYEYSYEEIEGMFEYFGMEVQSVVGVCINPSKIPKEERERAKDLSYKLGKAFGQGSFFHCVASAPLYDPRWAKNCLWEVTK